MASETELGLSTLTVDECRGLLVTHRPRLGRLAFVADDWPLVLPMNYALDGDVVYFRTAAGRKFFAASRRPRVTFQVDHVDEVWEDGWSLLAFGWLRMVEDPSELARVRHLPLRPWAGGDKPHFLALDIDSLSGRRIVG
jgi:nitroimidazol reductase NimA-like FMN-containing flavoprotein (pyridoxamine 5'-phosphate oxidase superfamily)